MSKLGISCSWAVSSAASTSDSKTWHAAECALSEGTPPLPLSCSSPLTSLCFLLVSLRRLFFLSSPSHTPPHSPNREAYNRNMASLLEENYNLALTQQRKNKDIPEGGSKGTILMTYDKDGQAIKPFHAFQKYVDCMLDVLMPTHVFDYYGKVRKE